MSRSPLFLAALASSAVPGLDPVSVQGVSARSDDRYEVAVVRDRQDREWVVEVPLTPSAGALLEDSTELTRLLSRRLDVTLPTYRGHAPVSEGRAAVYPRLAGHPLDLSALHPGPLAAAVGRVLAQVHNVEHLLYEEAGRPTYDAESHRLRRLSELDRAAATGHVPTALLTRWEHLLEDVSLWRFAPTAVHGSFTGANVLASFDDDADDATGRVVALLGWEQARVGDPADDLADLVAALDPDTFDAVLEAYAACRVERPDGHLVARARLAAEMAPLAGLLRATAEQRSDLVAEAADALRDLSGVLDALDDEYASEDERRAGRTRDTREARSDETADDAGPDSFPMLAQTQAIPMETVLDAYRRFEPSEGTDEPTPTAEDVGDRQHDATDLPGDESASVEALAPDPLPTAVDPEPAEGVDLDRPAPGPLDADAAAPAPVGLTPVEPDASVPYVEKGDASVFEIDDVEALPADGPRTQTSRPGHGE